MHASIATRVTKPNTRVPPGCWQGAVHVRHCGHASCRRAAWRPTARSQDPSQQPLETAESGTGSAAAAPPASNGQSSPVGRVLPHPPSLGSLNPRSGWNATALAYLGDAVWEIYARRKFFFPPTRMATYYQSVVRSVRAEAQAEVHTRLVSGGFLTQEERDVLRWGRNATGSTSPKRFGQADVAREVYRAATAVECLVGYLYLKDPPRLALLMEELGMSPQEP